MEKLQYIDWDNVGINIIKFCGVLIVVTATILFVAFLSKGIIFVITA